jgi:hypothetical protein
MGDTCELVVAETNACERSVWNGGFKASARACAPFGASHFCFGKSNQNPIARRDPVR